MDMTVDKALLVSQCLELGVLLEASVHKPGNISVVTDFENTRYEHFLASSVAATPHFEYAARRGIAISRGEANTAEAGVGRIIRNCVVDIDTWQNGGNTLLGAVILLSPMAIAAGMTDLNGTRFDIAKVRENLKIVAESSTPQDAVDVYEAIAIAKPSGLGKAPNLDVNDPKSASRILKEGVTLLEVFKIAQQYDRICSEWVNNYHITFSLAYPHLSERVENGEELRIAVLHTFLKVLTEYPDTFIARKAGLQKAQEVSGRAGVVLELGGLKTVAGRRSLSRFDQDLREASNLLNPGTTADIVAAGLSLLILSGYRP
jgi:triphosphoribosyl-dephospho-CoA synthase